MKHLLFIVAVQFAWLTSSPAAEVCSKSSPSYTIALLELYTSEGCSSCPPADKTVKQLYQTPGLTADNVIPLALHVDYWDYIGWKDPYAQPLHTERQNYLSALSGSRTIYTPEFFIGGLEFRNWRSDLLRAVKTINRQPALASIDIKLEKNVTNKLTLQIDTKTSQASELHYVLVEQGLSSSVSAGENKGETLQHDAVARDWGTVIKLTPELQNTSLVHLNIPINSKQKNLSVVAFVQNPQGKILQALSLPLCN
ncbi:DUF1223 domain-containing protein [Solimicrobium silvestre]|uniref:Putative secreted protein n=1 Tax=Solimicrobium silvestre TaxID=2099400 RepID=A0A2S9GV26_9BURK|nr:DUF1223 domain-containing protein [Solimicrobium silvestre]PRC91577.1 putative secreted protein [Solimicrobium silvestre]